MLEKMMAKQLAPMLLPKAQELEQSLLTYLKGIPLQEGETHATVVVDVDVTNTGELHVIFVVATFEKGTFSREIKRIPVIDFVKNLNLSEILK